MPIQYDPYLNLEKIIEFARALYLLPNGVSRTSACFVCVTGHGISKQGLPTKVFSEYALFVNSEAVCA